MPINPADPFEGLDPGLFTPEARARRQLVADLGQFQPEVPLDEVFPVDSGAQAQLEAGAEALRQIPREEWVRMCREVEAADPHHEARVRLWAETEARRAAAWDGPGDDDELSFLR